MKLNNTCFVAGSLLPFSKSCTQQWYHLVPLLLFIALLLGGCSPATEVVEKHWPNGNLHYRYTARITDTGLVKHGQQVNYHIHGALASKQPFVQGKLHGTAEYYTADGTLWKQSPFVEGTLRGVEKTFTNGILFSEKLWAPDTGWYKEYHPGGALAFTVPLRKGKRHGTYLRYDSLGIVVDSGTYSADKKEE